MSLFAPELVAGIGIGLAVAMPFGPMGVFCIQRTLTGGLGAGVATGFGAATIQIVWGSLALASLHRWSALWTGQGARTMSLISAVLLAWFAYRIVHRRVGLHLGGKREATALRRCFAGAVALGLTNPLTILLVAAAFQSSMAVASGANQSQILLGQFCGAFAWWIGVSVAVAVVRTRLSARALGRINWAAAAILAFLAVRATVRAFAA
jgi:putative LysE/RhtB family amino acid efflux pump